MIPLLSRAKLLAGVGVPLGALPRVLADAFGERPAVDGLTYGEIEERVARLAYGWRGVTGAVGVVCANRFDIVLNVLALARAGASPLPINHRLREEERAAALAAAGATAVVADAGVAVPRGLAALEASPGRGRLDDAIGDPPLLLCTSGTTGLPKVVRLSSRSLLGAVGRLHALPVGRPRAAKTLWSARLDLAQWLRAGRDVMLAALPLTHVMGLGTMLAGLCAGIRIIHLERFDAANVLDRIELDGPNVFVGVPTMYADLEAAGAAERDLGSIELWVSAADAMPEGRARRFQQYGTLAVPRGRRVGTAVFADVYGMVELGGPAAVRIYPPAPRGRELPSIGVLLPGFSARVVGADGRALRRGSAGELQLKGAGVFTGYERGDARGNGNGEAHGNGSAHGSVDARSGDASRSRDDARGSGNARSASGDGWFSTGDLARLGPGGTFAFVGRKADRLKIGGFSVFPAEVEAELRGHPRVAELAIVGVPDERLGERPVALVVPRDGFDADEFLAWASDRVAPYRRPRAVLTVPALPVGNNGKLDRRTATTFARSKINRGER